MPNKPNDSNLRWLPPTFLGFALLASANTFAAVHYPLSVSTTKGKTSTAAVSALGVEDQSYNDDDSSKYIKFIPGSTGLKSQLNFQTTASEVAAATGATLKVNFKGRSIIDQTWQLKVYDYSQGRWKTLGNNQNASYWLWSELTFDIPGTVSNYVQNGIVKVLYTTTSSIDSSALDYAELNIKQSTTTTTTPPPTTTTPTPVGQLPGTGRIPAGKLYGVTLDSVDQLSSITDSLSSMPVMPASRIVFDEFVPAKDYAAAASSISKVSYVMGEILDSFYVNQYSVNDYLLRVQEYLSTLGNSVDIWEVGNEINGEWLGTNADVVAKMTGAYDLVKQQGKVTELTLYYNQDCWEKSSNEMFTWAQNNIPDRMKTGLDYVLVSYYEDDCNGLQPDWPTVFDRLAKMFPNSRIGFGEIGTLTSSKKNEYIQRYYSTTINNSHYIGGYFWWYGRQDFVPKTTTYWSTLVNTISAK